MRKKKLFFQQKFCRRVNKDLVGTMALIAEPTTTHWYSLSSSFFLGMNVLMSLLSLDAYSVSILLLWSTKEP